MVKILKKPYIGVFGKSVLCFIGLAAASFGVKKLTDFFLYLKGSFLYKMLYISILQYVFWFVLLIVYAYMLFFLFKNEKKCRLIMILNGVSVFLQFYVLALLIRDEEVLFLSIMLSNLFGIPVIILSLMINNIASKKHLEVRSQKKIVNIFKMLLKSLLCFVALVIVIKGYGLLYRYALLIFGYLGFFIESFHLMWCLMSVTYAFMLYKLIHRYTYYRLVLILNVTFLVIIWVKIFMPDIVVPFIDNIQLSGICGNAAVITITLALIFRSVEKQGNSENSFVKDSLVANTPSLDVYGMTESKAGDN
jgi:hypothetical protein